MVKRILLVEDDADTASILQNILRQSGYIVECLNEGSKLVDSREDWPDLFILDKDMPSIDGLALCKYLKLKDATKNIPIIIISGHELKKKAVKAGAHVFIQKPFDTKKLLKAITKCNLALGLASH